ncbi:hypothetical protein BST61_g10056 [Cercospora zeina]
MANVQCYRNAFGRTVCRRTAWGGWGRWVLVACLIGVALLLVVLFVCCSSRRRRKAGRKPYYGTGWAAPAQGGGMKYNNSNNPPPMQQSYNNNNAQPYYSGGQNNDYYNPGNIYGNANYGNPGATGGYQPPSFPPPTQARNDGVIR